MTALKELFLLHGVAISLVLLLIILIVLGFTRKSSILKQICFNAAAVFFALFVYEIYLGIVDPEKHKIEPTITGTYKTMQYFANDTLLGYKPVSDTLFAISKVEIEGKIISDVSYSFKDGLRRTPDMNSSSKEFAIFLGCSFMFGQSLNDDETLPYYFSEYTERRYNIKNYAFHGYGPHQALAVIENILVNDTILKKADSVFAYYWFHPDHVRRAAGYSHWDVRGPCYEIIDEELVHTGTFEDRNLFVFEGKLYNRFHKIWSNSNIYKKHFMHVVEVSDYDIERAVLILKEMNDLLTNEGIKFSIILDAKSNAHESYSQINQMLIDEKIPAYRVSEIIENVDDNMDKYFIPLDAHPTKLHNQIVARYLSEN